MSKDSFCQQKQNSQKLAGHAILQTSFKENISHTCNFASAVWVPQSWESKGKSPYAAPPREESLIAAVLTTMIPLKKGGTVRFPWHKFPFHSQWTFKMSKFHHCPPPPPCHQSCNELHRTSNQNYCRSWNENRPETGSYLRQGEGNYSGEGSGDHMNSSNNSNQYN